MSLSVSLLLGWMQRGKLDSRTTGRQLTRPQPAERTGTGAGPTRLTQRDQLEP